MKVDAYITVRDINPRGLKTLHKELLAGKALLHHVIEKLKKVSSINDIAIVCETIDPFLENCRDLYDIRLHNSTLPDISRRDRFRRCRRWSANGWRGGLKYASVFDEDGWPAAFAIVNEAHPCDLIYQVSAEWPCLDIALSEKIIHHACQVMSSAKVVFHQASPGLLGAVYSPTTILQMAQNQLSLGDGLAVNNTGKENADEAIGPGNFEVSPLLSRNPWRFTADTTRQLKWINHLFENLPDNHSAENWIAQAKKQPFAEGPSREIEWEWSGENEGEHLTQELFSQLLEELTCYDDILITIDGRGPWITHPDWPKFCHQLIKKGCHGLHLRLNSKDLNSDRVTQLINSKATVISIVIDENFSDDSSNQHVKDLAEKRDSMNGPLMVVEMARTPELIPHWEEFWDRWFSSCDHLLWRYPSDYLGHIKSTSDLNLVRRFRAPCRKLFHELILRWNGEISLCREDWTSQHALGHYPKLSLRDATKQLQKKWIDQVENVLNEPCNHCDSWDRLTP